MHSTQNGFAYSAMLAFISTAIQLVDFWRPFCKMEMVPDVQNLE